MIASPDKAPRWLRRISAVVALTLLGRLVGFLYPTLLLRTFDRPAAGLAFFFINTAFFVVQPVSGGVPMAMVRPVAAAGDDDESAQWVRAGVRGSLLGVALACGLGLVACLTTDAPVFPMLLMVFGLTADAIYFQILTARRRYIAAATYRLTGNVVQLVVLAVLLALGTRSVTLAVAVFAVSYIAGAAILEAVHPDVVALLRRKVTATRAQRRRLVVTAIPTTITGFAYSGILALDTYLLRLQDNAVVAAYGAAKTLATPFLLVSFALMTIVQPEAARADERQAAALRRRMLRLGAIGGALAIAVCWAGAGPAIHAVYGSRYPDAAGALEWLGTGATLVGLHTLLQVWCWGRGRYVLPLVSLGAGAATAIACNLTLVPGHGAQGAGIAVAAGAAVSLALLTVLSAHAESQIRAAAYRIRGARGTAAAVISVGALSIGVGWVISRLGDIEDWELATAGALGLSVVAAAKLRVVHPLGLFPALFLTYFLVGSQNWVTLTASGSFRSFIDTNSFLRLPLLAIACYGAGVLLAERGRHRNPEQDQGAIALPREQVSRAGALLYVVGIPGAMLTVALHGLLLSNPDARAGVLGYESALALALIPGAVLLAISAKRKRRALTVLVATSAILLAVVGFRVTIVVMVLTYLTFTAMGKRRLSLRKFVVGLVTLGLVASLINAYRLAQSGTDSPYGAQVVPTSVLAHVPGLTPLYYSIPREGVAVFARFEQRVPAEAPLANGRLQFSAFRTLLPGTQLDPRSAVTQIVYATRQIPTTLTPTILGGPYGDFGELGVIVEMALLGILLGGLYRRARASPAARLAYAYAVAVAVAGIHTGVLDVQFVVGLPAMTILALWYAGRKRQREGGTQPAVA